MAEMSTIPTHNPAPPAVVAPAPATAQTPPSPTNFQLVRRMLSFIGPVRKTAFMACILVAIWALLEVSFVGLSGDILNRVKDSYDQGQLVSEPFWQAIHHPPL